MIFVQYAVQLHSIISIYGRGHFCLLRTALSIFLKCSSMSSKFVCFGRILLLRFSPPALFPCLLVRPLHTFQHRHSFHFWLVVKLQIVLTFGDKSRLIFYIFVFYFLFWGGNSQSTLMSCFEILFYPQATNVSLLRDGESYHLLPWMLNIVWKLLKHRQGWAN